MVIFVWFQPVKPAAVTAGEIAHGLVPTVHPAFMQAILSSPSSLSIYAPQLSAMQQAAYEELVRQKTMSNMVSGHSPYVVAPFSTNLPQSTEEVPK